MKRTINLMLILAVVGCSRDDDKGGVRPPASTKIRSLELFSSASTLLANGNSSVTFTVVAKDAQQTTVDDPDYTIYVDDIPQLSNVYRTTVVGEHTVYAKHDTVRSNMLTVTAKAVEPTVIRRIELKTNTSLLIIKASSHADLSVTFFDQHNRSVSNVNYEVVDNGTALPNNTLFYRTSTPGNHDIFIRVDSVVSNTISINARDNVYYAPISIPVIFHIVHFGEPIGSGTNLSQSQVNSLLNKLNDGFSNQYFSHNPNAVDTRVQFRLASLDESNNPLTELGINRIDATPYDTGYSSTAFDIPNDQLLGPNESWELGGDTYWNPRQYLNIWIYPDQEGRGSSSLPKVRQSYPLAGLGTVADNCQCDPTDQFYPSCKIHTSLALTTTSLIHEVGHVLGLLHNFSTDNCVTSDYCPDTYSYQFGNVSQACSDNLGIKVTDNFMDYTGSYITFTYDQRERIQHVLSYGLWFKELKNSTK